MSEKEWLGQDTGLTIRKIASSSEAIEDAIVNRKQIGKVNILDWPCRLLYGGK